jgi:hypothetical protein
VVSVSPNQHFLTIWLVLTCTTEDFNAIGKGGLFYLYQSLSAFQGYVTRMRALFVEEAFMTALSVDEIATDMKLDKVESKDKFDIFAILGAALSMAKIGTIGNPIAGGAVTFLSGFVGVMGKVTEPLVTFIISIFHFGSVADTSAQLTVRSQHNLEMLEKSP